ncbi:MAG: TonB-dependent receptor [Acidobacteria bacterium]|nr:TonB-dependent receptor [Acidobacteriota bacterium]
MFHLPKRLLYLLAVLLLAGAALGQATTSALTGTVTNDGNPLPGVTVTITSPALLGTRDTVTVANGDYYFPALPPGDYSITFALEGMQTITRKASLRLAETSRADVDLKVSKVAESITVTATAPSVLETPQVSTNLDAKLIEQLPVGRRIQDRVVLAPGVTQGGTNGQVVINGAQSFDNLYLVNGVVINENVRGQPQAAVIEDAIQETTLLTGGVSAEYGRFTGGVVSTITKSGGNSFSGSLRDNVTNDKWISRTPPEVAQHLDKMNNVYEATFGGRIITDRLWFFTAGRKEKSSISQNTISGRDANGVTFPSIGFSRGVDQKRYEVKLTGNVTAKHTLVGSYLKVNDAQTGTFFGNIVDLASVRSVENPIELTAVHYNGILTNSLLVEALYSQKDASIVGGGASARDRIGGTMLRDINNGWRGYSPTFCGVCAAKERNNKDWAAKANYFLATPSMGSHNLVAGYDEFHELRNENNYQSGSDFRFFGDFIMVNGVTFIHADPTLNASGVTRSRIQWDPLLGLSQTSDFTTQSLFVNDKWDLTQKLSFNVGIRYDKENGENQAKIKTVADDRFSPRLGVIYDLKGDGKQRVSFTYGRYAAKIDQGPADSTSTGGRYATYLFQYLGPEINKPGTPTAQLVPTPQVLTQVFNWLDANGGASNTNPLIFSAAVPGLNVRLDNKLKSPYMDELALGYGTQIGGNGYLRADLVHREWSDFYILQRDLTTGKTADGKLDVGQIRNGSNDDGFERNYNGLLVQGSYKLFGRVTLGGNYTYATLRGNVEGEEFNNATVPVGVIQPGGTEVFETPNYPELTSFRQNRPVGYLMGDIRNRANVWAQVDVPVPFGALNLGVLERYHSGQSFSAAAAINDLRSATNPTGIVNPGYAKPPTTVQYYFSKRGAYRLDDITSTDVNLTYTIPVTKVNVFIKADVLNAFNQQKVEFVESPNSTAGPVINKTVRTSVNSTALVPFNPFTDIPKACPNDRPVAQCAGLGFNYQLDPAFGRPTNKDAYQTPRTYRFAVGLRF